MNRYSVPYNQMSPRELQAEIDELQADINKGYVQHRNPCGCLAHRCLRHVLAEVRRREERKTVRASLRKGEYLCACRCGCSNVHTSPHGSFCSRCEGGMCGE